MHNKVAEGDEIALYDTNFAVVSLCDTGKYRPCSDSVIFNETC